MTLSGLRQRLHQAFGTWSGRFMLAAFAIALVGSSLPDLQWHSHPEGEVAHFHPAHDARVDLAKHHESHEDEAEPGSANLHFHDGNHCSAAPLPPLAPGVERLAQRDRTLGTEASAPATTALIPPYRPPIV